MKETGVIKFNCNWIKEEPLNPELLIDLNLWRDKMYELGFIGVNDEGIGYGNMSIRLKENQFIISAILSQYQQLSGNRSRKPQCPPYFCIEIWKKSFSCRD